MTIFIHTQQKLLHRFKKAQFLLEFLTKQCLHYRYVTACFRRVTHIVPYSGVSVMIYTAINHSKCQLYQLSADQPSITNYSAPLTATDQYAAHQRRLVGSFRLDCITADTAAHQNGQYLL